ncbi:MAG TPA: alanine racemase [Thermoanaerobaculia bacterium]|nr:alanine racemase [Thermoanaerobaculia bacterium]
MTLIEDLETPAVLVDLDVLERNIARQAERARAAGVKLRPHGKTHKTPEIGRMQLTAGASGLTLAKTGEAEVFADSGFDDLFLAYPIVGADKAKRLLALSDRIRLRVGADSVEGAATLSPAFGAAGRRLGVLLKIDTGLHRVGVAPERALETALRIAELPGIELAGIFTHAGHAYRQETPEGIEAVARSEGEILVAAAEVLRREGLAISELSVGSTPTAAHAMKVAGVTECRPGNYVFHDLSQVSLGACALSDCALTILATVVSVAVPGHAVLDAGSKTLSTDPLRPRASGHGLVQGGASRLSSLSEEHGVVEIGPGESFRVGQRVRVVPNHACVVTNLHDRIHAVRGGRVEAVWKVAARGRVD